MKKIIALILIVIGVYLAYMGINTIAGSESSVEVIGVELSATDEGAQSNGILYLALGLVALAGGGVLFSRK